MIKLVQFVCGLFGHFPEKHHKIAWPGNVIGPVLCRVCGHSGFVDEQDRYVGVDWEGEGRDGKTP
jgi:hypothetical protein